MQSFQSRSEQRTLRGMAVAYLTSRVQGPLGRSVRAVICRDDAAQSGCQGTNQALFGQERKAHNGEGASDWPPLSPEQPIGLVHPQCLRRLAHEVGYIQLGDSGR